MIKILDSSYERQGVIKKTLKTSRVEEINGENTLDFMVVLDETTGSYITEDSIFELDSDYFDLAVFKKDTNSDGTYIFNIESEHISYRLNKPEYNKEYFTETGTPIYILGKILEGTGFTIGGVEFTELTTYSAQEAKSRRQLLMEFVAYLGGEINFFRSEVSILIRRGDPISKPLIKGKHVSVISQVINKREKDAEGNSLVSYTCEPINLPDEEYQLGDNVLLVHKDMGIFEELRVVRIKSNPYDAEKTEFDFANYVNGLASSLYRIETLGVVKDKLYNGTRIGPEFGFENILSNKKARSYFNSTGMAMQVGDGSGENWVDILYVDIDPDTGEAEFVWNGKLSAAVFEAIEAEIDVVISNTTIVQNLYAEYGRIANLSVSELDTSWRKITNYLNEDTSDVTYMKMYDDKFETWTAVVIPESSGVQYTNKDGSLLYWVDNTYLVGGMTTNDTGIPVMVYEYLEQLKKIEQMELINSVYVPTKTEGLGTGVGDNGKLKTYKGVDGYHMKYITETGIEVPFSMTNSGFVDAKHRRTKSCLINTTNSTIEVVAEGQTIPEIVGYVESQVNNFDDDTVDEIVTFTWPDGFITTVTMKFGMV